MNFTDQLGFAFRAPERRTWTVRELVAAVRTHIEREYGDAWVEGEISNFRAFFYFGAWSFSSSATSTRRRHTAA